jgi:hypothetical protein
MIGIKVRPIVHEKIIKEALSRIGIANKKDRVLFPSCYLTLEDGDYIIAHFKELFPMLTNGNDESDETDIVRRNTIIGMLVSWNLIELEEDYEEANSFVFVLRKADKPDWRIQHKINLKTLNRVEAENIVH